MADAIDVVAAWICIEGRSRPLGPETVALEAARGRVLAAAVHVDRDAPPFDRAAMDGYAVRAQDVAPARRDAPCTLAVVGESRPGRPHAGAAAPGSAVRIMTGAPVPAGWDSVVPVEQTSGFAADRVDVYAGVDAGANVARRGSERRAGEVLLEPGRRLRADDIGALAMVGAARVGVGRRPRVAILATGDELVAHADVPGPYAIRDSNGPMLQALASQLASEAMRVGMATDAPEALAAAIGRGLEADVLILTGGMSMGAYDHVGAALEKAGVSLHFRRVAMQPGKPTAFGTHTGGYVVALPGNPVSALTAFRLFAAPLLARLEGCREMRPRWSRAEARFAWERRHAKWLFLPGRSVEDGTAVQRVAYAGSGDLLAQARADCQIVLTPGVERVLPGDPVSVWPL